VPKLSLKKYSKEQLKELSLLEMAYEYLKNSKQPIGFKDLMNEIKKAASISDQEIRTRLAQFYTDLNIDGRFLALGENRWGLRVWYPVDTAEEEVAAVVKPKKKKAKKVVDEEIEDYEEVDEDYDELDEFAEEEDDLLDDEVEEIDEVDEFDDEDEEEVIVEEEFDLGVEVLDEDLEEEELVEETEEEDDDL
jgi:DNA-directed RNA polymerase subunit delta